MVFLTWKGNKRSKTESVIDPGWLFNRSSVSKTEIENLKHFNFLIYWYAYTVVEDLNPPLAFAKKRRGFKLVRGVISGHKLGGFRVFVDFRAPVTSDQLRVFLCIFDFSSNILKSFSGLCIFRQPVKIFTGNFDFSKNLPKPEKPISEKLLH